MAITNISKVQEGTYAITTTCPLCRKEQVIEVPAQGWWDWNHRTSIQVAFPGLTEDQREALVTGIDSACWDKVTAEEDD
jgi:hypothetical protein